MNSVMINYISHGRKDQLNYGAKVRHPQRSKTKKKEEEKKVLTPWIKTIAGINQIDTNLSLESRAS